jgi:DNA-binding CsgD family transcriptional regulator
MDCDTLRHGATCRATWACVSRQAALMGFLWFGRSARRVGEPRLSEEQKAEVLELADDGLTSRDIAEELGVNIRSVQRVLQAARQKRPATLKQTVEEFKANLLVKAIEKSPDAEERAMEGLLDQVFGGAKDKPLNQSQLMEAKGFFNSQGLQPDAPERNRRLASSRSIARAPPRKRARPCRQVERKAGRAWRR